MLIITTTVVNKNERGDTVDIIDGLQQMGFSLYEAKVYTALVGHPNVTGYEASKFSGVPRGKVYEVLESLVRRGAVLVINEPDRQLYQPLPHKILLSRYIEKQNAIVKGVSAELTILENKQEAPPLITLKGYRQVIERAREMCEESQSSLLTGGFPQELSLINEELTKAEQRGIKTYALQYGPGALSINNLFIHSVTDIQHRQMQQYGRWFCIIKDMGEAIIAQVLEHDTVALWTGHRGVVLALSLWLQHDIAIVALASELPPDIGVKASLTMNDKLEELWCIGLERDRR